MHRTPPPAPACTQGGRRDTEPHAQVRCYNAPSSAPMPNPLTSTAHTNITTQDERHNDDSPAQELISPTLVHHIRRRRRGVKSRMGLCVLLGSLGGPDGHYDRDTAQSSKASGWPGTPRREMRLGRSAQRDDSRERSARVAPCTSAVNGKDPTRQMSQSTRSPCPATWRPRRSVATNDAERMHMFPQQGCVVERARLAGQQGASPASVYLPVPRLGPDIGPKSAPGSQDGTRPHDTQGSRLVAEDRGGCPAIREANSNHSRTHPEPRHGTLP